LKAGPKLGSLVTEKFITSYANELGCLFQVSEHSFVLGTGLRAQFKKIELKLRALSSSAALPKLGHSVIETVFNIKNELA
jgi:hypothetical protein